MACAIFGWRKHVPVRRLAQPKPRGTRAILRVHTISVFRNSAVGLNAIRMPHNRKPKKLRVA